MFAFPGAWKVFVAVEPVDMRKHFDGLWAQAELHLGENPRQGALFVFANKDRNRLKMLYWDGTGVWVMKYAGWKRAGNVACNITGLMLCRRNVEQTAR